MEIRVKQTGYMSPEEKRKLDIYLFGKGLSYEPIAKLLKVSRPAISLKFGGKRPISAEERRKIYNFLDEDSSLDFLVNDNSQDTPEIDESWNQLFDSYYNKLRGVYEGQKPEVKGKFLGELEKIIGKYS